MDFDLVFYSIMFGDNSSNFVIDSWIGVVCLVKYREFNFVGLFYVFNISVLDGLYSS